MRSTCALRAGCIAMLLALPAAGSGDAVPEPDGLWTGPINSPVPATLAGGTVVHAAELARLLRTEPVLVVDVSNAPRRPAELPTGSPWMPLPHPAIPGSLWIPDVGLGVIPAELDGAFRERLVRATDGNREHPVVFYCHERCWLSWNAAKRAIGYGYRRVYWFPEGIEGWQAAGHPTEFVEPAPSLE